eukprot:evm.model.NODE_19521_length_34721_cov_28.145790.4
MELALASGQDWAADFWPLTTGVSTDTFSNIMGASTTSSPGMLQQEQQPLGQATFEQQQQHHQHQHQQPPPAMRAQLMIPLEEFNAIRLDYERRSKEKKLADATIERDWVTKDGSRIPKAKMLKNYYPTNLILHRFFDLMYGRLLRAQPISASVEEQMQSINPFLKTRPLAVFLPPVRGEGTGPTGAGFKMEGESSSSISSSSSSRSSIQTSLFYFEATTVNEELMLGMMGGMSHIPFGAASELSPHRRQQHNHSGSSSGSAGGYSQSSGSKMVSATQGLQIDGAGMLMPSPVQRKKLKMQQPQKQQQQQQQQQQHHRSSSRRRESLDSLGLPPCLSNLDLHHSFGIGPSWCSIDYPTEQQQQQQQQLTVSHVQAMPVQQQQYQQQQQQQPQQAVHCARMFSFSSTLSSALPICALMVSELKAQEENERC